LCRYLRYIEAVVEDVLVEYAESVVAISRVLAADGGVRQLKVPGGDN
jgi:hypothetical protein